MRFSLNKLARLQQKKVLLIIVAGALMLVVIGSMFAPASKHVTSKPKPIPDMTGITKSEFTGAETNSALQQEAGQIDDLHKEIAALKEQLGSLQKTINASTNNNQEILQKLQDKISSVGEETARQMPQGRAATRINTISQTPPPGITTVSFSYSSEDKIKNPTNYVPPGTFAKAVLLSGADTNAGVNGQTDTQPITLRILDNGTLPNGEHSSLKNCFVTAAAYGDASSERGQIRLQRLSCVRGNGRILDVAVEGTISDMGGSDGVRGHVVMRNGKLLWNAGFSGFLSGIGSAMQQSLTTQSVSPLGATTTVPSGQIFQYGVYGGANTALGKLADYYIKLADLYHPIIQIHAGSNVDITFLKGFYLDDGNQTDLGVTTKAVTENLTPPDLVIPPTPENLRKLSAIGQYGVQGIDNKPRLPDLHNVHLGQTLN